MNTADEYEGPDLQPGASTRLCEACKNRRKVCSLAETDDGVIGCAVLKVLEELDHAPLPVHVALVIGTRAILLISIPGPGGHGRWVPS